ncbi:hypothetical protein LSUE1_G007852 [Lachnellula suecica]|uniref:Glycoside hydrolase family 43 protein n=1 Tax=Lachnellula suecica TaxID=602035 RepID=A0A8T9C935_9HELO|nr:hypothetical protein LSUE1_G007852 [Lachnellula suecica]
MYWPWLLAGFLGIYIVPSSCAYISFNSSVFNVKLDDASRTLASLSPKSLPSFDFSPFDLLANRSQDGNYHTGDINFRYRKVVQSSWTSVDTATKRVPVLSKPASQSQFSVSNLSPTIPASLPFNITKAWGFEDGDMLLSVTMVNNGADKLEIGAFGFPIEFNSIFTGRTAVEVQTKCSLTDPNIGLHGGYLRVTPLSGTGPALVVTPLNHTPFEAWRFLPEDESTTLAYQSQTFEGFYSWEVFSKAYAENEWNSTVPWNTGSSTTLTAGQSITLGLRFSLAESISSIDTAVVKSGTPLARGLPGFIIPVDLDSYLYLNYTSPVSSIASSPLSAITFTETGPGTYKLSPSTSTWGRVRVEIMYSDNKTQTVHYYVTKSAPEAISDLGNFLTTSQWFTDTSDPFKRVPSVITYDRSVNRQVTQDPRVWIAGLSDEAGAGSWLAAAMKQAAQPNEGEVAKLEQFIHGVLWGTLQNPDFSVKKSVFFYQPGAVSYNYDTSINWANWWSWDETDAFNTRRAYDYVHVTAAYWAIYRVARAYPSLVSKANWECYLNQSYHTVVYSMSNDASGNSNTDYSDDGLMGETVFGELLEDLKRENLTSEAANLESLMKKRADLWNSQAVPYGSEMAWDSTGQEGVYYWSDYFGMTTTATKTINSILGYMPTVSHWAWNGNARRYWDNIYGGKLQRIERQGHHYGSGLNALPLLAHFQANPTDSYALRVGFAGNSGPLSNIDAEGFASASFHTWPETLAWDAYSGDYGPNFVGLVLGSGTYVVQDPELGLVAYGGRLVTGNDGTVTVQPRDAVRRKVYLAMYGMQFSIDAGAIESVKYGNDTVVITVAPSVDGLTSMALAESAVLWIEKKANVGGKTTIAVDKGLEVSRGGWKVDLASGAHSVNATFS